MFRLICVCFLVIGLAQLSGCGKSNIESNCSSNGYGQGSCSFTNTGSGAGSVCGKVTVSSIYDKNNATQSSLFCSGDVQPSSTVDVKFTVPNVSSLCSGSDGRNTGVRRSWNEMCNLSWEQK